MEDWPSDGETSGEGVATDRLRRRWRHATSPTGTAAYWLARSANSCTGKPVTQFVFAQIISKKIFFFPNNIQKKFTHFDTHPHMIDKGTGELGRVCTEFLSFQELIQKPPRQTTSECT